MQNTRFYKILILFFKTVFTLLSLFFIFDKIKNRNINDFFNADFSSGSILIFILVLFLMPVNWTGEAIKWKILIGKISEISLKKSLKAVLTGIPFALVSPARTGELIGRVFVLDKKIRAKAVVAASVGSLTQMLATLTAGIIAGFFYSVFYPEKAINISENGIISIKILSVFSFFVIVLVLANLKKIISFLQKRNISLKILKTINFIAEYDKKSILKITGLSFFRYFVFSFQFVLLLYFFNVEISFFDAFTGIALTYLVSSSVPVLSFLEIGIRSSAAVVFLGLFSGNLEGIISATVMLWLINLVIPSLAGIFIFIRAKI